MTWPADIGAWSLLVLALVALVYGTVRATIAVLGASMEAADAFRVAAKAEIAAQAAHDVAAAAVEDLKAAEQLLAGAQKRARELEMDIREVCRQTGVKRSTIKLG